METFLWTIAAALVVGLAKVAWSTPKLYGKRSSGFLLLAFIFIQGVFQVWNFAIRLDSEALRKMTPEKSVELLDISQGLLVPNLWWAVLVCSFVYLMLLHVLAILKIQHDRGA